jgi:hypothetical protein
LVLGLELRAYTLSHSSSPFYCDGFFQERISRTICPGWLQTMILLISASWEATITGMSHWHPASTLVLDPFCFIGSASTFWLYFVLPSWISMTNHFDTHLFAFFIHLDLLL